MLTFSSPSWSARLRNGGRCRTFTNLRRRWASSWPKRTMAP